ncbi:MAG: 2-oxoacid:acceptor oxidoreductase family protein [Thermoplasmata archaeon]
MIKIRIGGWAGQGIALAGNILAASLALKQGMYAVQKRSYSAAVRSSISHSDVIADREPLDELVVDVPDYLIVLYQETLDQWRDIACGSGTLIIDSTRVSASRIQCKTVSVPAGEIAEKSGSSKSANMVLLGALAGCSSEVDLEALKNTVRDNLPSPSIEMNLDALQKGYEVVREGKP